MKRFILFITFLGMVSIPAMAGFISPEQACEVARHFMAERTHLAPAGVVFEAGNIFPVKDGNMSLLYVINFKNDQGFILVSADDRAKPVLGFAFERQFEPEKMHPAIADWLEGYRVQLIAIIAQDLPPFPETTMEWEKYLDPSFEADKVLLAVNPLIQTTWDQGCYYNASCPYDGSAYQTCYHTLTGCGATAMAQIHKYYNYPVHGVGSHTYYDPNYGTQSANFANATYSYAQMPANVTSTNDEVAELMYHCGVAQEMEYGVNGSLSYTSKIDVAFRTFFNYNQGAEWRLMSDYNSTQWTSMLRGELDQAHPLLYFGNSTSGGGHFFVCDGYQGTDYFHFNWGWSGQSDGYYYLNNLTPGGSNFNDNQRAIFQCYPPATTPVAQFSGTPTSGSAPLAVQFTDLSSGNPTSWSWNFGDGGTSSQQNPTHTFLSNGSYTVSLTVTNTQGNDTETKTGYINVGGGGGNIILDFESQQDFSLTFTPWSINDVDGSTTYGFEDYDFQHEYEAMAYLAFNPASTTPAMTDPDIQPHGGVRFGACFASVNPPNNDWLISPQVTVATGASISFWVRSYTDAYGLERYNVAVSTTNTNPSSFSVISGAGYLEAPTYWQQKQYSLDAYAGQAIYVAIQCVSNDAFVFMVDDIVINAGSVGPTLNADFAASQTQINPGQSVSFTDLSTGSPTSWSWSFQGGNPSSSTLQNPANITYGTPGVYNVSLTVGNGTTTDTETKTGYITVNQGYPTYMTLDFEGLADFTTSFNPWTTFDGTGANTYSITDHTFPSNGTPFAYMAFNFMEVEPPITSAQAHSGNRFGACFSTTDQSAVDKWLISPQMSFGNHPGLAMWVMTFADDWGLETYEVGISTTNNNPSSFNIISGPNDLEAPATWTKVGFVLNGLQNTSGYVGIHCTSADKFIFMVDDIEIGESLGISDHQQTGTVSIYPNPAADIVYLQTERNLHVVPVVRIFDRLGMLMKELVLPGLASGFSQIDVSDLPQGLYLLEVSTTVKQFTGKICIVR